MLKQQELRDLEEEFKKTGYTDEIIKEIEKMDGAIEIEDFISNLEGEKSYWGSSI